MSCPWPTSLSPPTHLSLIPLLPTSPSPPTHLSFPSYPPLLPLLPTSPSPPTHLSFLLPHTQVWKFTFNPTSTRDSPAKRTFPVDRMTAKRYMSTALLSMSSGLTWRAGAKVCVELKFYIATYRLSIQNHTQMISTIHVHMTGYMVGHTRWTYGWAYGST